MVLATSAVILALSLGLAVSIAFAVLAERSAREAVRFRNDPGIRGSDLGVRPARVITP